MSKSAFIYVMKAENSKKQQALFCRLCCHSSFALQVTLLTELCIKREPSTSRPLYLKVDLLGQFFSFVVLGTEVAVGGQSQEGRVHGAATCLTAEILRPAREQLVQKKQKKQTIGAVPKQDSKCSTCLIYLFITGVL